MAPGQAENKPMRIFERV